MLFTKKKKAEGLEDVQAAATPMPEPEESAPQAEPQAPAGTAAPADAKPAEAEAPVSEKKKLSDSIDALVSKYRAVDYSRLDRSKMYSVIYELIVNLEKANYALNKYDSENLEFFDKTESTEGEKQKIIGLIEYMARKLSSTYNSESAKGENKKRTPAALVDLIVSDVLADKGAMQKKVIKLMENEIQYRKLIDSLSQQITDQAVQASKASSDDDAVSVGDDEIKSFGDSVSADDVPDDSAPAAVRAPAPRLAPSGATPSVTVQSSKTSDIALVAVDIRRARELLTDSDKTVIEAIGSTGKSCYVDIAEECSTKQMTESKVKTSFARLENMHAVDSENVSTLFVRGKKKIVSLSKPVGEALYKDCSIKPFVPSEKEWIAKKYPTLIHGYSVLEMADALVKCGYKDVKFGQNAASLPVGDNQYWEPDVSGIDPNTKEVQYFQTFFGLDRDKLGKFLTLANANASLLKLVTGNEAEKGMLKAHVNEWMAGNSKCIRPMKIEILTYIELSRGIPGIVISTDAGGKGGTAE